MMQFRDLKAQYQALKTEIDAGMADVLASGQFILGRQVGELEQKLAEDVKRSYCVSCANGTDALVLSLMLWGIGPGDAAFVPDFTYFASAGCASTVGAEVIPVDIDLTTFNMCPDALEAAIERVKAEGKFRPAVVIPVDLFGLPAAHDRIAAIAKKHGMRVLEDGAQGYGGQIGDRQACSFGDAATTSFFPAKPLGCYGDGGAIFVDSAEEDALLRSLRANGRGVEDKYDNQRIGMNSRLDTLQAAILLPKLKALREYEIAAINEAARKYTQTLCDVVKTPVIPEGYTSSWAQYSVLLGNREQRDNVQRTLREQGIPTMVYYPRGVHQQTAYADRHWGDELFPNTIEAANRILSLPMHPYLTDEDIETVSAALKKAVCG